MVKHLRLLVSTAFLMGLIGFTGITAFAVTPPAFTSATYNVGTGSLVITGTNMVPVTGLANDINLAKVSITDSLCNTYTLSTKGEIASATEATIKLNAKDAAALSGILDKAGTSALNGGIYQINVLSGWNGVTSKNDLSNHALTVSGVAALSSATYDVATGKLVLTGSNMAVTTGALNDIMPKYLTITDKATKSITLTSPGVELSSASEATITLNTADKLALSAFMDKNGTKTVANNTYCISAAYGWNGKNELASLPVLNVDGSVNDHIITVSNYVAPTATLKTSAVTYGGSITTTLTSIATSKAGTVYVVPSDYTIDQDTTVVILDGWVTEGSALKASVRDPKAAISIGIRAPFKLTTTTADFKVVAVDLAGTMSNVPAERITINNIAAPTLTATAAAGTAIGTTKVTATAGAGNSLAYEYSATTIATPKVGTDVTLATGTVAAGSVYAYTSGANITGIDATTNKYLGIFELDANKKVVKFKLITLTATYISAPKIKSAAASGTTLTLTTDTLKTTVTPAVTAFVVKIGTTANKVTAVVVNGTTVTLTLTTAVKAGDTVTVAYIKPSTNYLQDANGECGCFGIGGIYNGNSILTEIAA